MVLIDFRNRSWLAQNRTNEDPQWSTMTAKPSSQTQAYGHNEVRQESGGPTPTNESSWAESLWWRFSNGIFIWWEKARRREKNLMALILEKRLKSIWSTASSGYEAHCTLRFVGLFLDEMPSWCPLLSPTLPNNAHHHCFHCLVNSSFFKTQLNTLPCAGRTTCPFVL